MNDKFERETAGDSKPKEEKGLYIVKTVYQVFGPKGEKIAEVLDHFQAATLLYHLNGHKN